MTSLSNSSDYINTTDYKKLETKLDEVKAILDDLTDKTIASRRLRYAEIDIEVEREAGRIQPDEMYIPVHTIDTNIRREQSSYIQYLTQSPRAVICKDATDSSVDLSLLEDDLTKKLRYDGWQRPMFSNADGMQQNGYSIMEVVYDTSVPGNVIAEQVASCDFAFVADTKDIQACEMVGRQYYFTKTKLLALCGDPKQPSDADWNREEVERVVSKDSPASSADPLESSDDKDKSLFRVQKLMFRVNGVVQVGWACIGVGEDWLRAPRPLFIGRRKVTAPAQPAQPAQQVGMMVIPPKPATPVQHEAVYETMYPYVLFQYLISENDKISHLKGRVFLDQDVQEGVSSLLSSTVTQARRAGGLIGSKDTDDPNDDILQQSNIYFKPNCLVNKKVSFTYLPAPEPGMFQAIQVLALGNQQETSQVNFAENNNQRDSRKTAKAVTFAQETKQELTGVQVVLFSLGLTELYQKMVAVIKSRVLCGLIQVDPKVASLYERTFIIKPSGDVDVIEKKQLIGMMAQSLEIMLKTPAGPAFLCDLLELAFPNTAAKYCQLIMQAQQQQQSQQAQQQQMMMQFAMKMAQGILELDKHKDWFSESGQVGAYPIVEQFALQIKQMQQQMKQQPQQGQQ